MTSSARFDLSGKVAVVTGGAGIIGSHVCHGLAEHGADVAVVDIDGNRALQLAGEIHREHGSRCLPVTCDVTDARAVAEMVRTVESQLGPIGVLHNNAAGKSGDMDAFFAPFEAYSLDEWRAILQINLDGMFLVAQAVGSAMIRVGQGGSIIQTSSVYGIAAPDQRIYEGSEYLGRPINTPAVYSASKAAVVGLTRHLATLWAHHGIRVNTITPGGVESGQNDEFRRRYGARVPLGRMARAEEMVGAVVFLAGDAASYVTGHNLVVDGGLTAW